MIKAYVRVFMAHRVFEALEASGPHRVSVIHVRELGDGMDPFELRIFMEYGGRYTGRVNLELIRSEEEVEGIVGPISEYAQAGHGDDGVVAVLPLERSVKTGPDESRSG